MLRISRNFAGSLILLAGAAVAAPNANAWPLGKVFHYHPNRAQTQDSRVRLQLFNKGHLFQDVQVGGKVYTVFPNQKLVITAPVGTSIYAGSTGLGHRKGDLLIQVGPQMDGSTVSFN